MFSTKIPVKSSYLCRRQWIPLQLILEEHLKNSTSNNLILAKVTSKSKIAVDNPSSATLSQINAALQPFIP
jgi:hypothetical protein